MFSYAEAETVLARLHGADGDVRTGAFRGRLKHLKRLGIPMGSRPGKGSKVSYTTDQLYEWAFCLELEEFGLDPTLIEQILRYNWASLLLPAFREVGMSGKDTYFYFGPYFMTRSWGGNAKSVFPEFGDIGLASAKELATIIGSASSDMRLCIINLTKLTMAIGTEVLFVRKTA